MKESILKSKSFSLAVRIVRLYRYLCEQKTEYVLSKQVLRSGTSVVLWFVGQHIQKVKLTLPIKWELHERSSMRHFIG